jgi:acetyl esterase/lipase
MFFSFLRLALAAVLFLLSVMVVVPATHLVLWYVVILVTELGHWFSLASLGLLIWELVAHRRHPNFLTLALGLASLVLFLKPLVQATLIARKLPAGLAAAFGEKGRGPGLPAAPLSDVQLWNLAPGPAVQEREYSFPARDGTPLPLRFYTDGGPGLEPGIVIIHGGGWNSGNERQLPKWSRKLASLGFRVASISYRLAPRSHWPAQKEDVATALAFLHAHAGELGLDSSRLVILGRSAGGQIALDAAYTLRDPAIRGCIASYSPTDMNFAYWTGKEDDMLGSRPLVRGLMGGPPSSDPALYRDASPLDFVGAGTPPTLLIHGTRDEIVWVRHSERLRDRLQQAGRPVFLLELPWATHGFDVVPRGPGGQLELYAMVWFLNAVLRGS